MMCWNGIGLCQLRPQWGSDICVTTASCHGGESAPDRRCIVPSPAADGNHREGRGASRLVVAANVIPGLQESADGFDQVGDRTAGKRAAQPGRSVDDPGPHAAVVMPGTDNDDQRLLPRRWSAELSHRAIVDPRRPRCVASTCSTKSTVDAALTPEASDQSMIHPRRRWAVIDKRRTVGRSMDVGGAVRDDDATSFTKNTHSGTARPGDAHEQ